VGKDTSTRPEGRKRIGDMLVDDGIMTLAQLGDALKAQKEREDHPRLGRLVIELGYVSEHAVARAIARQLGLSTVDLTERSPDSDALQTIPRRVAERHDLLPLEVRSSDDLLVVAMSDPTDVLALDDVRARTGLRHIEVLVATSSALENALQRAYDADSAAARLVERLGGTDVDVESLDDNDVDVGADTEVDEPVIALVNALLADAVRSRTSDVHVEPERHGVRVRYRVDGLLREVQTIPRRMGPAVTSRLKIMSSLDISERRRPQDGRAMIRVGPAEVDLRVSTMPTMHGETVVLRLLRKGSERLSIDLLGLDDAQRSIYVDALHQPQGLIVLTGPTGSGKTTSLYAGIGEVVDPELNIVTLEDPVEYEFEGVNQSQMNPKVGLTFATGLRTVLRQDPDVVMVGEIRDNETSQLAVEASFTGHLVLSTLHTNDAPSTVARMVELGVERFLLATSLLLVVAQRLGRRICDECRTVAPPPDDRLLGHLGLDRAAIEGITFEHGTGCNVCDDTGYVGRIGFYEMLRLTPRMRQLISDGGNELQIGALARAEGMKSLRQDGITKAVDGVTTLEEVVRITPDDQFRSDRRAVTRDDEGPEALAVRVGAVMQPRALLVGDADALLALDAAVPEGWRRSSAADLEEAVARAEADSPDVIVLTEQVNGSTGIEVARRLRAVVDKDVHLVLRTLTQADDHVRAEAAAVGIDDVVSGGDDDLDGLRQLLDTVLPTG
jgi:type IV pilus assembly protein PilB